MSSIYFYSEDQTRCVELKTPAISPADLVHLQEILPRQLKGVSFNKPEPLESSPPSKTLFYSESREFLISKYLIQIGETLLKSGEPLGALHFFELSERIDENKTPHFRLLRAEAMIGVGQMEEAEEEIQRFLSDHPQNSLSAFLLGRIALQRNHYAEAKDYFQEAKNLHSEGTLNDLLSLHIEFSEIYLDRDLLYSKNLSPFEYRLEIESLLQRTSRLRSKTEQTKHPEAKALTIYLDNLEKLFESWLNQIPRKEALI